MADQENPITSQDVQKGPLEQMRRTPLPPYFGDCDGKSALLFDEAERFCKMAVKMGVEYGDGGKGFAPKVLAALYNEYPIKPGTRTRARKLWLSKTIKNRIAVLKHEEWAKLGKDTQSLVAEAARIAFSNVQDIHKVIQTGNPMEVTRDQAAAIESVQVDTYMEGRGENAREVKQVKVKMHDKLGAIDKLMRLNGMFKEDNRQLGEGVADTLLDIAARVMARRTSQTRTEQGPQLDGSSDSR